MFSIADEEAPKPSAELANRLQDLGVIFSEHHLLLTFSLPKPIFFRIIVNDQ